MSKVSRYFKMLLNLLRLHQWGKNILVFIPLFFAHKVNEASLLKLACWSFFSFSLIASAIYIVNDIFDKKYDENHPSKRLRPIACSLVSPRKALFLMMVCAALAYAMALSVSYISLLMLILYTGLNLLYSLKFKFLYFFDLLLLSLFYLLRIFYGGIVTGIEVSSWLLGISFCLFLNLAALKRFVEICHHGQSFGKAYTVDDQLFFKWIGLLSSFGFVLLYILYVVIGVKVELYKHPWLLWPVGGLIWIWLARAWFLAHQRRLNDDPVKYALLSPFSWLIASMSVFLIIGASR